jgi:hypothetical protein
MTAWWPSVAAALARRLLSRYDISRDPAVRRRSVGWRVSRHDMVCNEAPWALTVIAMAALRPRSA